MGVVEFSNISSEVCENFLWIFHIRLLLVLTYSLLPCYLSCTSCDHSDQYTSVFGKYSTLAFFTQQHCLPIISVYQSPKTF